MASELRFWFKNDSQETRGLFSVAIYEFLWTVGQLDTVPSDPRASEVIRNP